jgi:hypothetical protein
LNNEISLTISHEELVFILKLMKWPLILGVGEEPLPGLNDEQMDAVMRAAGHSLLARRLVAPAEEGKVLVERLLAALLAPCVAPQFSLIISHSKREELLPEVRYYHATNGMLVEHAINGPALHTFTALSSSGDLQQRILAFLDLKTSVSAIVPPFKITQAALSQAVSDVARDNGDPTTILIASGLEPKVVSVFAQDLAARRSLSNLFVIRHQETDEPRSAGFGLLESADHTWLLQPQELPNDPSIIFIKPISIGEIKDQLELLLIEFMAVSVPILNENSAL